MSKCKICEKEIDYNLVNEDFEELTEQADTFGLQSLTEDEQMVFEGKICSFNCFEELKRRNS